MNLMKGFFITWPSLVCVVFEFFVTVRGRERKRDEVKERSVISLVCKQHAAIYM